MRHTTCPSFLFVVFDSSTADSMWWFSMATMSGCARCATPGPIDAGTLHGISPPQGVGATALPTAPSCDARSGPLHQVNRCIGVCIWVCIDVCPGGLHRGYEPGCASGRAPGMCTSGCASQGAAFGVYDMCFPHRGMHRVCIECASGTSRLRIGVRIK